MVLFEYLSAAFLLVLAAHLVFRVLVRRDYQRFGRLSPLTSFLEFVVWFSYVFFPHVYNPSDWWLVWFAKTPDSTDQKSTGTLLVVAGMVIALVAMAKLGLRTTMGNKQGILQQAGLYSVSRNPQLVGGGLAALGVTILWPSWYALGWLVLYGVIGHLMVRTEEEHLRLSLGEAYLEYCRKVSRYIKIPWE